MSKWTPEENQTLISEVDSLGQKWKKISSKFPHRNENSIRKHYEMLNKAKMPEKNGEILLYSTSIDDDIRKIILKKLSNKEKLLQLKTFSEVDIFRNTICLSNEIPTMCPILSIFLKYLFDNSFKIQTFWELAQEIHCSLLLQYCRTFSIFEDTDLMLIDYIKHDIFFFRGPKFHIKSQDEILNFARDEKKTKISNQNEQQKLEIARLHKIIKSQDFDIHELNSKINDLKEKESFLMKILDKSRIEQKKLIMKQFQYLKN